MKKLIALLLITACLFSMALIGCGKDGVDDGQSNDDNFVGLYDNVESDREFDFRYTKENMLYDFEEIESLRRGIYYYNICAEASLCTDKKYVTCGNSSAKFVAHGRADKGYWSMLYFIFDDKYADFRKIKSINIDIMYETVDGSDVKYSVGGTGSNANNRFESESKVYAKSGEWYTFVIKPNEKQFSCRIGSTWSRRDEEGPGVYMPEDQLRAMNNLYFSFAPFKQGDKPITVYIDNFYVEFFE